MQTPPSTAARGNSNWAVDSISARHAQIVLPAQYFSTQTPHIPERRLMAAVLQDALDCVGKYRLADNVRGRRLFWEAKRWFLNEAVDWPFSFEHICEVLSLDSNAVRRSLRLAGSRPLTLPVKRTETPLGS